MWGVGIKSWGRGLGLGDQELCACSTFSCSERLSTHETPPASPLPCFNLTDPPFWRGGGGGFPSSENIPNIGENIARTSTFGWEGLDALSRV